MFDSVQALRWRENEVIFGRLYDNSRKAPIGCMALNLLTKKTTNPSVRDHVKRLLFIATAYGAKALMVSANAQIVPMHT
ncbi:MAG: hypothetical protein A2201_12725 [Alicyclobacillus sp. RIFOXYA1_FULL_53_8]|nr:MAG: hypothetical protein A2201_12725 [Alicyclobacillus sp. RIFOXYA1_FULL_53_8]